MEGILTLNQALFAVNSKERRLSRRARRALCSELYVPVESEVITYDEGYEIDGGGQFKLTLSCTAGGFVSGLTSGAITGFCVGLVSGFCTKLGASIGGWKGALITGAIGAVVGWAISSVVNDLVYGKKGPSSVTLIDIWIPFFDYTKDIDLGEKLGGALGGFGGGMGGFALSVAAMTALGYSSGFAA